MLIILDHQRPVDPASLELLHLVAQRLGEPRVALLSNLVEPERRDTFVGHPAHTAAAISVAAPATKSMASALNSLTDAEREVAQLIVRQYTSKSVATQRGTSIATVRTQRSKIYEKLSVSSAAELVRKFGEALDGLPE